MRFHGYSNQLKNIQNMRFHGYSNYLKNIQNIRFFKKIFNYLTFFEVIQYHLEGFLYY